MLEKRIVTQNLPFAVDVKRRVYCLMIQQRLIILAPRQNRASTEPQPRIQTLPSANFTLLASFLPARSLLLGLTSLLLSLLLPRLGDRLTSKLRPFVPMPLSQLPSLPVGAGT